MSFGFLCESCITHLEVLKVKVLMVRKLLANDTPGHWTLNDIVVVGNIDFRDWKEEIFAFVAAALRLARLSLKSRG